MAPSCGDSHFSKNFQLEGKRTLPLPVTTQTDVETGQPASPCVMVVFGAGGDLAKRKLFPALYNLAKDRLLPNEFAIVGFGRSLGSTEDFRKKVSPELRKFAASEIDPKVVEWLVNRLYVQIGTFEEASAYEQLGGLLARLDKDHGTQGNRFYYLATAPDFSEKVVQKLCATGLTREEEGNGGA